MVQLKNSTLPTRQTPALATDFSRKRSGGFALIGVLVLLPFLLSVFLLAGELSRIARDQAKAQGACEARIFLTLDRYAQAMNGLFELNPQALQLRLDYNTTKVDLGIAEAEQNHVLAAQLRIQLARIQMQRKALDGRQKQLISETKITKTAQAQLLKIEMRSYEPILRIPELQVEPDVRKDLAPTYKAKPDLPKNQMARVDFHLDKLDLHCAVTVEPRFGVYRARLTDVL